MKATNNKAEICLLVKENGEFVPVFSSIFKVSKRRNIGREEAFGLWQIAMAIGSNRSLDGYESLITVSHDRGTEIISNRVINSLTGCR